MIQLTLALEQACSLRRALQWALETVDCAPATRHMHAVHARYWIDDLGDVDVRSVDYPRIREWMTEKRRRGLAKETLKKRLVTLKFALLEAVYHRQLERLPQWPVIRSDTRPTAGFWKRDQLDSALMVCDDEDFAAWITCGWWGGMHLSDLDRFRWGDVDLSKGTWVRRNTKTKVQPAVLTLPDDWRAALEVRRAQVAGHPRDLIAAHPMGNCNADLRLLCVRAGVPRISTIGLRHSAATWLHADGFSSALAQHWLGLTSERMLQRHYRHVTETDVAAEMQKLGRAA